MGSWEHVANYDWRDESGEVVARHIKWLLPDGSKSMPWRMYRPGTKRWMNPRDLLDAGLVERPMPYERLLFNLPELLAAGPDANVLWAEGEADCLALAERGLLAVTHGHAGSLTPAQVEWFRGWRGRITLAMDYDPAGRLDVLDRYDALVGVGVSPRQLRIVRGRIKERNADVRDHLNVGHSVEELVCVSVSKLRRSTAAKYPTPAHRRKALAEDDYDGYNPRTGFVNVSADEIASLAGWAPVGSS